MNKFVDMKKLILRLWLILWAILAILLVLKFLFHNWYPIVINNETLWHINNYVDNNKIPRYIILITIYCISSYLTILISTKRKRTSIVEFGIIVILATASDITKSYNQYLGILTEIIVLIIYPTIINIKTKPFNKTILNILFPLIFNIVMFVWQLNFLLIRDYKAIIADTPVLVQLALQIDYYTFLIITYLGVCFMGLIGPWLFGKKTTELRAMKAEELAKANPDKVLMEEIDAELKRRNEK